MEWKITVREDPPIVVMQVSGTFTVEGCTAGIRELAAVKDPLWPVLFDDREVDFSRTSAIDLMEVNSLLTANLGAFAYSKIGVLVDTPEGEATASSWGRLAEFSSGTSVRVFQDEAEAIRWLSDAG